MIRSASLLFAVSFVSAYLFSVDFEYYGGSTTAEWALKKLFRRCECLR